MKNQSESNAATLDVPEESAAVRMGDVVLYRGHSGECSAAIATGDELPDGSLSITVFVQGLQPTPLWGVAGDPAGEKPLTWSRR